jgi:Holliday junction resolvase RusA-like endonuclease
VSLFLEFTAWGVPKGQPRARAVIRGKHAGVYDPGTADGWKSTVRLAAKDVWNGKPLEGPVRLTIHANMPRPPAHVRANGLLKHWAPKWHTGKPDADNLAKAIMDALTAVGIWKDDTQVAVLLVTKRYANDPAPPHAVIRVEELTE